MRTQHKMPVMLAMLLLALSLFAGTGVDAQDATPDVLQPDDLEGLQHSVVRAYTIDYSTMFETAATPGAEMQMSAGIYVLGATILEFDNAGNAESALFKLADETEAQDEMNRNEGAEVSDLDLDLGDNNVSYTSVEDVEGVETETVVSLVQGGNYVYFLVAGGNDTDVQRTVVEFATVLIENDGGGEGEFNEDGTSSGGLWEKFPAADDALFAGLVPYDQVLYPEPTGTPGV